MVKLVVIECIMFAQAQFNKLINKLLTSNKQTGTIENLQVSWMISYDQILDMNHWTCNDSIL
jgi:hypothetical protein